MAHAMVLAAATLGALLHAPQSGDGQSRYAQLGKTRIHYQSHGKGSEALVLIHGWTCNLDNWRDQIPDLAARTRVIAVDLPGHGLSDKPDTSYTMDFFADAVEAVLKAEGVERAVLVGHSMGTPVARQYYRKHPKKTLGLVLVDGPLVPFGDRKLMESFIAPFRAPNYKEAGAGMLAAMAGPGLSEEMKARISASFLNTPQQVVVSAMEAMAEESIWKPDPVTVPALAIMAKSPTHPPDLEARNRAVAPKLEIEIWEGVGHFLMMEQPRRFNAAVISFLDRNALLKR